MHVLIAPDKFKDALSAAEAANAMAAGLKEAIPEATYTLLPLADGGEGTAALLTKLNKGQSRQQWVWGPKGEAVQAAWGFSSVNQQAYIELAEASGLQLLPPRLRNPLYTTTFGTGELIAAALRQGATSLILGLGGSATNDGGTGMAAALGYRFLDKKGKPLHFLSAEKLLSICRIDTTAVSPLLHRCSILAACDVNNPLLGPQGASYTFALQKGANFEDLPALEEGLAHLSLLIKQELGKEVSHLPGSGAAGGAGAGVLAFLQGSLQNGTQLMLEQSRFEEALEKADVLLTGEGSFDASSLQGKLIVELCRLAKRKKKPVVAFCGSIELAKEEALPENLKALQSISWAEESLEMALKNTAANLRTSVRELFLQG